MPHPTTPESVPALIDGIDLDWRKSSHSGDQGACVEMAPAGDAVAVRDSKDPAGPMLRFPTTAWNAFAAAPPRP